MDGTGSVLDRTTAQLNRGGVVPYTRDYVGAVKLLENSGFSPFTGGSPLGSTLNRVFSRFVEKTGLGADASILRNEYLEENSIARRALGLYNALENTFGARGESEKAAIVDFLDTKIEEFVAAKDQDDDGMLTLEESELSPTLFKEADRDRDSQLSAEELRNHFYNNFPELNNVMNYFQSTPGILIDVYG